MPRNRGAEKHGARALASGRGTPLDRARIASTEAAVLDDLGGADEVSEAMAVLVRDFAFAVCLRDLLSAHLAAVGPMTRAGKRRAALSAWHKASARVEALAQKIGTERQARELTPAAAIAAAPSLSSASDPKSNGSTDPEPAPAPSRGPVPLPGLPGLEASP